MSTRSVIVVTGLDCLRNDPQTVRLYKHCDGDPRWVGKVINKATRLAKQGVEEEKGWVRPRFLNDERDPTAFDYPADSFAHQLIAADVSWHGAGTRLDTDEDYSGIHPIDKSAIYHHKLAANHFGDQGDLEWVYLLDLPKRTLSIWGTGNGGPNEMRRQGVTDPLRACERLKDEDHYKGDEFLAINKVMQEARDLGWTIAKPKRPLPDATRLDLQDRAWASLLDLPMAPEWKTSTVTALLLHIDYKKDYDKCPILADALEDAGCEDQELLTGLRVMTI